MMKSIIYIAIISIVMASCNNKGSENKNKTDNSSKPNIIYILADDLGYGELGCYGQEKIETPSIDALAKSGMRFTQHYSGAPVCAPARCTFLTGQHMGHAVVRGNDEWEDRGKIWNYRAMIADSTLEGQRPMPDSIVTIAKLLKKAGYTTGIIGKWGLGAPHTSSIPTKQGFDYFFGYNCQRLAHTYYPVHLYENEHRVYLNNDTIAPNTKLPKNANPKDESSYANYTLNEYSPDLMFNKLTNFVKRNKQKPFFLYWATPIPHVPLQAPKDLVNQYKNKFGEEEPYVGNKGYFPARYPHATYAAMIANLDKRVGELIKLLKKLNIYDNTLIIFTSDNGPTFSGGTDSPWFNSGGDFKSEYGWGKGFLHEGGIRIPFIASFPNKIKPNSISNHISYFPDMFPTFCELAGIKTTTKTDGISLWPELIGEKQKKHEYLYWEFPEMGGEVAVRIGNYKALCRNMQKKPDAKFELYNLKNDPQEQTNIADEHPEIINKVKEIVKKEHVKNKNPKWQIKSLDK